MHVRKEERYKINNIGFHLRKLDKEGQIKSKVRRRREIRFRSEISETENRKSIEKINKGINWFFEKITVIDKPLARLNKTKIDKIQITNNIRWDIIVPWTLKGIQLSAHQI